MLRKRLSRDKLSQNKDFFLHEKKAREAGFKMIAGIDEAGRGPLAGPVVASAVIINNPGFKERIDDSKKLTARMRERAFLEILNHCDVGIGMASVEEIDRFNIYNATLLTMKRAVEELKKQPDYFLIDGKMNIPLPQPRAYIISGDSLSVSIACASIVAKVFRDTLMREHDKLYPQYGFHQHKGYGTSEHMERIRKHGLCPIHRKTFGPFGKKGKMQN
ncbi:MAG: ribonuclease HII [Candidatus Omnitrophota bacterium]